MNRVWVVVLLAASMPALAQWLPDPGTNPPFLSTPGDVTSGGTVDAARVDVRGELGVDGGAIVAHDLAVGGFVYATDGVFDTLTVQNTGTAGSSLLGGTVSLGGVTYTCTPGRYGGAECVQVQGGILAQSVDAGLGLFARVGNPDGGRLNVPAGLTVDTGSYICLDGPTCNFRQLTTGINMSFQTGGGRGVFNDGLTTNTDLQAGNTSANGVNLAGGATSATLRVSGGAAPTPNAALRLQAAGPDGIVDVVNDAGVVARIVRHTPRQLADVPPCTQEWAGARVALALPAPDGGVYAPQQECDGQHWVVARGILPIGALAKSGSGPIFRLDPNQPFAIPSATASIQTAGTGPGASFEVIMRQGATVLCRGGASCTTPSPDAFAIACTGTTVYVSPDAGIAHAFIVEVDAGCAQTPAFTMLPSTNFYGYPDPGFFGPPP